MQFLRVLVGVLAILFAYALGRSVARLQRNGQPLRKALTWLLRVIVCIFAVLWVGAFDATSIATLAAALVCLALGFYLEWRPRHVEDVHLFNDQNQ